MSKSPMFLHFRPLNHVFEVISPRGGATLAYTFVSEDVVEVSVSRCSKKDVFNKKLGRTISSGRLFSDRVPDAIIQVDPLKQVSAQVIEHFAKQMAEHDLYI